MGSKASRKKQIEIVMTNFDELSNDVIYEIFDYLSYHDILHAFQNLNSRFNLLIDTYAHYVNLQQCHNQLLPTNILILKITARYQFQWIDFTRIKSLRGLMISNLSTTMVHHILRTIALDRLEYVYLGASEFIHTSHDCANEIQEMILSLGNQNLQKCVFRLKFIANIDRLPETLSTLEYLRIDGCENVFQVDQLLNRMPNLVSLHVSILSSISSMNFPTKNNPKHQSLTKLSIQFSTDIKFEELIILFLNHGSHVKKLVLKINIYEQRLLTHSFKNIWPNILTLINEYLPQLTHVHVRYHNLFQTNVFSRVKTAPYIEQIPSSQEHQTFQLRYSYD